MAFFSFLNVSSPQKHPMLFHDLPRSDVDAQTLISVSIPPITCGTFALCSETTSDFLAIGAH
ncbi:hypothetical protein NQZ68_022753 [Dissostichus eleginoides]|nr:hypothetical protein NQZ68_022753 [Dissostichus eleginoides]